MLRLLINFHKRLDFSIEDNFESVQIISAKCLTDSSSKHRILQIISPTLTSCNKTRETYLFKFLFSLLWSCAILIKIIIINRDPLHVLWKEKYKETNKDGTNRKKLKYTSHIKNRPVFIISDFFETKTQMSTTLMSQVKMNLIICLTREKSANRCQHSSTNGNNAQHSISKPVIFSSIWAAFCVKINSTANPFLCRFCSVGTCYAESLRRNFFLSNK